MRNNPWICIRPGCNQIVRNKSLECDECLAQRRSNEALPSWAFELLKIVVVVAGLGVAAFLVWSVR